MKAETSHLAIGRFPLYCESVSIRAFPWMGLVFASAFISMFASIARCALGGSPSGWWFLGSALALLISLGFGIFFMSAGLFARPIIGAQVSSSGNRLALTFDDGPNDRETPAVLELLESRGHRATFFVIGERAAAATTLLSDMVRRGHALGNHSYRHSWATAFMPAGRLAAELERAQAVLAQAGTTSRWFRPPAGVLSPRVVDAAKRARLELVGWTRSARDGVATDIDRAVRRLANAARPGVILVLHDGAEQSNRQPIAQAVLKQLLPILDAKGLVSVTLDQLLSPGDRQKS